MNISLLLVVKALVLNNYSVAMVPMVRDNVPYGIKFIDARNHKYYIEYNMNLQRVVAMCGEDFCRLINFLGKQDGHQN